MIIYINGNYTEQDLSISIKDRGLLLGDGLFETILVREGWPVFLSDHIERMQVGCAALQIPFILDKDNVFNVIRELIVKNEFEGENLAVRVTVSRGSSDRGLLFPSSKMLSPTFMITLAKLNPSPDFFSYTFGPYIRSSVALSSRFKTLNYLENVMARNHAVANGFDEALMCNENGDVVCGAASNVFILMSEKHIVTSRCEDGALAGIVRDKLKNLAPEINLTWAEQSVERSMLEQGFVFFSNSLIGLVPAQKALNHKFEQLRTAYETCIADDIATLKRLHTL